MSVSHVPKGFHSVTPYLAIDGAARAIAFYKDVFGARERIRVPGQPGKISHAELEIGDSVIMLSDAWDEKFVPPRRGEASVSIHLCVEDVDKVFARARANGAVPVRKLDTNFHGGRSGTVRDPFGHYWHISTPVEDVTEQARRPVAADVTEIRRPIAARPTAAPPPAQAAFVPLAPVAAQVAQAAQAAFASVALGRFGRLAWAKEDRMVP
jgi:PhnB protein